MTAERDEPGFVAFASSAAATDLNSGVRVAGLVDSSEGMSVERGVDTGSHEAFACIDSKFARNRVCQPDVGTVTITDHRVDTPIDVDTVTFVPDGWCEHHVTKRDMETKGEGLLTYFCPDHRTGNLADSHLASIR